MVYIILNTQAPIVSTAGIFTLDNITNNFSKTITILIKMLLAIVSWLFLLCNNNPRLFIARQRGQI